MTVVAMILVGQGNVAKGSTGCQAANAGAKAPAYEVISIKPSKVWHPWRNMPDGLSGATTLLSLIYIAYGPLMPGQIAGWPAWSTSAEFDIEAKMDEDTAAALQKLPQKQQATRRRLMLQSLLADRFNLRVHHEIKTLPIYELVVAKGGSKLKESNARETNTNGIGRLTAQAMPMADLALILTIQVGRIVVDKTGLTGGYDFALRWMPDQGGEPPDASGLPLQDDSGPSIFTALQEQLGLKLEPAKGPVEMLVIEHVERPSEN
jgi:uncharacterized protein (TIGR03435 family)